MRWTIRRKLLLVFVVVAAMMSGGTGVAFWAEVEGQATEKQIAQTLEMLKDLEHLGSYVRAVTAMQRAYLVSGDPSAVAGIPALRQDANGVIERVETEVASQSDEAAHMARWRQLLVERRAFTDRLLAARRDQGFDAAKTIFDTGEDNRLFQAMEQEVQSISEQATARLRRQEESNQSFQHLMELTEAVGVSFALVLLMVMAYTLARSIECNVKTSIDLVQAMAGRDLAIGDGEAASNDELAVAIEAINTLKQSMAKALQELAQSSLQVATAGSRIETTAREISETTRAELGNVEHFATSIAEMNDAVREVAEHASRAAAAANDAVSTAVSGRDTVEQTQEAMHRIRDTVSEASSDILKLGKETESIGEVVRIIQDIAGQTNLLALNAAIEAARAGELGKGFAVVAQEVRTLAERTTKFTKEIADKISSVQQGAGRAVKSMQQGEAVVSEGVTRFNQVAQTLDAIAQRIEAAQNGIAMIATATTQQSSATAGLTGNINSITGDTGRIAQRVDEAADACAEVAKLAALQRSVIASFRLPDAA